MARKNSGWNEVLVVLVELLGFGLSFYLYLISVRVLYPESVPCPAGKIFACGSILRLKQYSYIGPFSIALLGVLYFVVQLAMTALVHRLSWMRWVKFLSVLGGLGFVAYLRAYELLDLHKICPWCYGVALVTILQATLVYPLGTPPLPRLKPLARFGVVFGAFALLIGLSIGASLLLKRTTKTAGGESATRQEEIAAPTPKATATPKASQTPKASPTAAAVTATAAPHKSPKAKPSPAATASPVIVSAYEATPTPANASGAAPLPSPRMGHLPMPPSEKVKENDETKILRSRGWHLYSNPETVMDVIVTHPPVLFLAYDPLCEECYALVHDTLSSPDFDRLPITRVAIESTNLTGMLQGLVTDVPTLILFNEAGQMSFKHVGRMEKNKLMQELQKHLGGR